MNKKWMVFCLVLFAMVAAGPVSAEEAAATGSSPTLLPVFGASSEAPSLCKAAPLSKAQVPAAPAGLFEGSADDGSSEACFPAECGSGASQQQCSSSCCRNKCCIC